MQRSGGAIETDIAGDRPGLGARIQDVGLRHLVDEAALGKNVKEIGLIGAHESLLQRSGRGWCNRSGVKEKGFGFGGRAGNWFDERDLARWRRCGADRDRWRAHRRLRADRLPALFGPVSYTH